MRIQNSDDFNKAPLQITPQDLAIIFDQLNLGLRRQLQIMNDIWEHNKWILPKTYHAKNKKKKYIEDVLYQIDYLYHKEEIDGSLGVIKKNASELGYRVNTEEFTEDYHEISEFFKALWIQLKYVNQSGYTRAKIRTILNRYHYKRRSEKICQYFDDCTYYYKMAPTVNGTKCDIRTVSIDAMITFRLLKRRPRKK